jgi:hypothetical protein
MLMACERNMSDRETAADSGSALGHTVVDFPAADGAITPQQASKFLAILLRFRLFAFVGVIIIGFTTGGGIKLPEIGCDEVVVGHKPSMLPLLGVGGPGGAIYEARYQITIRDVRIPVPYVITKWFTNGLRCGQP